MSDTKFGEKFNSLEVKTDEKFNSLEKRFDTMWKLQIIMLGAILGIFGTLLGILYKLFLM